MLEYLGEISGRTDERHRITGGFQKYLEALGDSRLILDGNNVFGHGSYSLLCIGSANENVDPLPFSLSTQMRPPWRSTMSREIASPSPSPDTSAVRRSSRLRTKGLKMPSCSSGVMPMPKSCISIFTSCGVPFAR